LLLVQAVRAATDSIRHLQDLLLMAEVLLELLVVQVVEPVGVVNTNGVQSHQEFLVKVTQVAQDTITQIGVIPMEAVAVLVVQAVGEHQVREEVLEVVVPDYNTQSQALQHTTLVVAEAAKVVVLGTAVAVTAAVDPLAQEVLTQAVVAVTVTAVQVL
jgi:hypothetical protein